MNRLRPLLRPRTSRLTSSRLLARSSGSSERDLEANLHRRTHLLHRKQSPTSSSRVSTCYSRLFASSLVAEMHLSTLHLRQNPSLTMSSNARSRCVLTPLGLLCQCFPISSDEERRPHQTPRLHPRPGRSTTQVRIHLPRLHLVCNLFVGLKIY
jgi:hypothetical protein